MTMPNPAVNTAPRLRRVAGYVESLGTTRNTNHGG
jgi:hypothetical protein